LARPDIDCEGAFITDDQEASLVKIEHNSVFAVLIMRPPIEAALELKPGYSTVGKALRVSFPQFRQIYNLFCEHFACASRIAVKLEDGFVDLDGLPRNV
jgi:hypothetical protein